MKKRSAFFLLPLVISGAVAISWIVIRYPLARYVPIIQGPDQRLIPANEMNTEQHLDRVEQVLAYYDQPYRRLESTDLRIPWALVLDRDLVWNYTLKAEDTDWLATR